MPRQWKVLLFVAALACVLLAGIIYLRGLDVQTEPRSQRSVTIGLVTNNPNGLRNIDGFVKGLQALGYSAGEDVTFLFAGKPTPQDDLEAAIRAMVRDGADLIFTAGTPTGVAALAATRDSRVPVVFGVIADPVAAGVMSNLTSPGGNMTGVMLSENQARRLALLRTLLPRARRVLLPYNPDDPAPLSAAKQLADAAPLLDLTLVHAHARTNAEVSAMLAAFPKDVDAVFMLPDSTVNRRGRELIGAATASGIPVSGPSTAQVEAGAMMSYGIVHREVGIQASRIADRILRGADPATTPVEIADFYLTINIAAANRIGLDLPRDVLRQADVIVYEDDFLK